MRSLLKITRDRPKILGENAVRSKRKRYLLTKLLVIMLITVLLGGGGYAGYYAYVQATLPLSTKIARETELMNEAVRQGNNAQALADAKKILTYTPNDLNAIYTVANMEMAVNPREAQKYFAQILTEFKKQNNPDVSGKTAETYWAAAGLAERAGQINQAKKYYQAVIQSAKPLDKYEQSLAAQSQAALKRGAS